MSVELAPGYISFSQQIEEKEAQVTLLYAEIEQRQADLDAVKSALASNEASLKSWQNAGSSDPENKAERIRFYKNGIAEKKAEIANIKKDIADINFEAETLKSTIKNLKSMRDAFVKNYNESIVKGATSDEANMLGLEGAESADTENAWYKNTWVIVGLSLLGAAGIYLIIKKLT